MDVEALLAALGQPQGHVLEVEKHRKVLSVAFVHLICAP